MSTVIAPCIDLEAAIPSDRAQLCADCGALYYLARNVCPLCGCAHGVPMGVILGERKPLIMTIRKANAALRELSQALRVRA